MTTLELTLLCSNVVFLTLWLWQALLLARTTRALEVSNRTNAGLVLANQEYKLAYTTLEQFKGLGEAQQAVIANVQTMNERISSYNERLNELNAAVRIKVERIDKNTMKL